MLNDLIDFPVSDLWRDHYAAQGLTYPSGRKERPPQETPPTETELASLHTTIEELGKRIEELKLRLAHPHLAQVEDAPKKPIAFDEE